MWERLTHVEHVLKRPDSYVGSVARDAASAWVRRGDGFARADVRYAPGLIKIFDEILVNAIDQNAMAPASVTRIAVDVDRDAGTISVANNGAGIPIEMHAEGMWLPELIFGHLLTSSNYDDAQERTTGGRNGYGAKLTNIFSSRFSIEVKCPASGKSYRQTWSDNMGACAPPKIGKFSGADGLVRITFAPDWTRFGCAGIDDDAFGIIEKRVYDAAVCSSAQVRFQGKVVAARTLAKYAALHTSEKLTVVESPRWSVAVAFSGGDGLKQVSWVNGICTTKGGAHVDHVVTIVANAVHAELISKNKDGKIRPHHVKQHLFVFVRATLVNPTFSSQTKDECTSKVSAFGSRFAIDAKQVKAIVRSGVGDEIMSLSKFRELKDLKKTDGAKKSRIAGIPKLDDANWAGTTKGTRCTLIVTEGDSAKALAVAGLSVVGRNAYGVFPLRGKPRNVRDASVKSLSTNQEFMDLKKILGLQQGKTYASLDELRYGRLMIMTDADLDGSHIKGLVLNMIHCFWPSLLKLGFVVSMVTPIIKATRGKQTVSFYTDQTFRRWEKTHASGWRVKYYKGLGTSTSVEAREYFKAIDKLTVGFADADGTDDAILLAFDKPRADDRKTWLTNTIASPPPEVPYGDIQSLDVSRFINEDMVNFSIADVNRSIPHMVDGLKPSQRKVAFACFKRGTGREETKVVQLAGYVSEKTAYHHGEQSLIGTIINLAQDFVGSNNVNLLEPCGQFGTRLMGGKDAASPRYIFTRLMPATRTLFDPRDDAVLTYMTDDGKPIEPRNYVPVIPMVLVNGAEGIGTGFSCSVPPFDPRDVVANLRRVIRGEPVVAMTPWFRGFRGSVRPGPKPQTWIATGVFEDGVVTELPPGRWTQDYRETLDALVDKGVIGGYDNHSTDEAPRFVVRGYSGKDPVKDLKLARTVHATNMHLMTPGGIKRYACAEDILRDFVRVRVATYARRRAHMIATLEATLATLDDKCRFIRLVVDGELVVFRRKRADLVADLGARGFRDADALLNIKTYQYTDEAIREAEAEAAKSRTELAATRRATVGGMWSADLDTVA